MYSGSEDGTVRIWDLRAPGCQREYQSRAAVNTVMLHPNQGELISGARPCYCASNIPASLVGWLLRGRQPARKESHVGRHCWP